MVPCIFLVDNDKTLEEKNRALRAKIKRIEQERDIFKKGAAYFASQDL